MVPGNRIFIGSSVEGRKYAECIGRILANYSIEPVAWWDPACFPASSTAIASLESVAGKVDGAILVASPDDKTTRRGDELFTPSINVMLEYGLFLGRLSRSQVAIALVHGATLPSDLAGVNYIRLPPMREGAVDPAFENFQAPPLIQAWLEQLPASLDVVRSASPHLEAIYERSGGQLRFIVPALDVPALESEASKDTGLSPAEGSRLTMMTSLEGMAYGWLLKAFSPFMSGGRRIECIPAHRGHITRGIATFILGGPSTNPLTERILASMRHPDTTTAKDTDYGDIITYKGEEFKTQYLRGFRNRDFSFLIYNSDYELFICAGTSPFGTAGAVSMLAEPQEGEGTRGISELIMNRQPFRAIGEVEIITETDWQFKRVVRIDLDASGTGITP